MPAGSRKRWLFGAAVAVIVLFALDALARVGGGQSYGGGGRRGGGGHSFGGGGGDGIVWLIFQLLFRYPLVGIPVLALAIWVAIVMARQAKAQRGEQDPVLVTAPSKPKHDLAASLVELRLHDPAFSKYLFIDFCTLLYSRVAEARPGGKLETVLAFVAPELATRLGKTTPEAVADVVVGVAELQSLHLRHERAEAVVRFEASLRERWDGQWMHLYRAETWTFERRADARSLPPESAIAFHCPSCGAAAEVDAQGRCRYCTNVVNGGDFGWIVRAIAVAETKPLARVDLELGPGGVEVGTNLPTVRQPGFDAAKRAFMARCPDVTDASLQDRARFVFMELQTAWSSLEWERARPYETDALFQTHRYWIERHRRDGLRNCLDDVAISRIVACKFEPDPWYETVTVRIYASMRDYTVDAAGKVVSGNRSVARSFSEYWTFIRRAGHVPAARKPHGQCPSCGAPMKVDLMGICAYCEAKVASGDFDWVVAAITQDEVYRG